VNELGPGASIDIDKLIESRMLIQANSGGGKSWAIRRILEQSHGKVQHIILDLEGEFSTLREQYDYLLIGKEGDIPINLKVAALLPKKLLEIGVDAIIDLSELKHHERILFVKRFLDALVNAPKRLWKPVLVVVDEAHQFCPEKGKAESGPSVIDLMTRGRKRGFCGLLATQRLSKLSKDAAAECNNKLIGRTGLDVDMKRAGDELGFSSKEDTLSLRSLKPGEFYAFGPAISNAVTKIMIGDVKTTHPTSGGYALRKSTPAPAKIQKLIETLTGLPEEAEQELRTIEDLRKELADTRRKLTIAEKPLKGALEKAEQKGYQQGFAAGKDSVPKHTETHVTNNKDAAVLKQVAQLVKPYLSVKKAAPVYTKESSVVPKQATAPDEETNNVVPKPNAGAMRMLKAAASFHPNTTTRQRIATIAGLSYKSGTFGTYLSQLRRIGYLEDVNGEFLVTPEGMAAAGDVQPLPTDHQSLRELWKTRFGGGAARMIDALCDAYPEALSREELGLRAGITHTSGTFGTYLSKLRRNGLVETEGSDFKAAKELFP
jgi:hypothetical protein